MRTCKISDCEVKHYAKGYCERHYKQLQRHGKITNKEPVMRYEECRWCGDGWVPVYAKGLCKTHYFEWYNYKQQQTM